MSIMRNSDRDSVESVRPGTQAWSDIKAEFHAAQDGQCAICRQAVTLDASQLDHCHETGFVRGVLCVSCNTKLGFYETRRRDIEAYLSQAAEFAAYIVPSRVASRMSKRVRASRQAQAERWRRYWQEKAV